MAILDNRMISLLVAIIVLILLYFVFRLVLRISQRPGNVRKTSNLLAYLALAAESLFLPKDMRKEIIGLLGNVKGKILFEYGCSVGTLTLDLAEEVGRNGRIYATDISERNVAITNRRLMRKGHKHVTVMHDLEHHNRIHPKIPKVHVAVSVGNIGYVKNVKKVLKELNKRLNKGSRICFIDYDKFFEIISNVEWLSDDDKIKKMFSDAGFSVSVKRKQGFFWKYVFIYGKKVRDVR